MPELKLARLAERTPIKLTISIMPDLNERLIAYADLYRETYGRKESVADLIPAMLTAFVDGDRAFARKRAGA